MDVWTLAVAALRRWYVLLPGLILTALATMSAGNAIAPEYATTGAVLLVQPALGSDPTNAFASASGPEVLRTIVNASEVRRSFAARDLDPDYELWITNRTAIVNLTVRSDQRERALATGQVLVTRLAEELAAAQAQIGVPPGKAVTIRVLEAPGTLSTIGSQALRVQAVVALVGFVLSAAAAILFDDALLILTRYRNSRQVLPPNERAAVSRAPSVKGTRRVETAQHLRTAPRTRGGTSKTPAKPASGEAGDVATGTGFSA